MWTMTITSTTTAYTHPEDTAGSGCYFHHYDYIRVPFSRRLSFQHCTLVNVRSS